ncbi:MAG: hypothetical protein IBX72_15195 [Nitrospirae bacterium]|nr:hypothetical protein [Nitrospirota bacterium]
MTSGDIVDIKCGGVACKSDLGLYSDHFRSNYVYFLSLYGSPQQVRAIFSLLSTWRQLEATIGSEKIHIQREHQCSLRFRGYSIGYGKQHGIIWVEDIAERIVFWISPEEKLKALRYALSKRKIPFDASWISAIETLMGRNNHLESLKGWGGGGGYICNWNDDAICDLIAERLKKGKDLSCIHEPRTQVGA